MSDLDRGAQTLADLAWMEVAPLPLAPYERITLVIKTYLWAIESQKPWGTNGLMSYPSLNDLREWLPTVLPAHAVAVLGVPAKEENDA